MALTQTDLDNLKSALAKGQLEVEYEGRRVKYRSIAELKEAIGYVEMELAKNSSSAKPAIVYAAYSSE
jgi:hypothetical protein